MAKDWVLLREYDARKERRLLIRISSIDQIQDRGEYCQVMVNGEHEYVAHTFKELVEMIDAAQMNGDATTKPPPMPAGDDGRLGP